MMQRVALWLFNNAALLVAGFNIYWAVRGLFTGAVPNLHKFSMDSVYWSAQPVTFAITLTLHAIIGVACLAWVRAVLRREIER